jgi:hypothetical protein
MPFIVSESGRTNLFIWAQDWTGVTENGNTTPDWWFWEYYGTVNLSDTNLDSQGNTLLSDYQGGTDPNIISFTMRLGDQNFNTINATGSYVVLTGVPSYEAVLVNDTNLNDAVWQPYDGIVHMNLGTMDGVYQVELGLKGLAADSQQTWLGTEVTLTRTAPQIFITNPTTNVVATPYLQLQGYSLLPLAGVTFDVSNATSFATNQSGSIIGHTVNTNTLTYTTDYFQCYDIPLTNGINTITLHCTDLAGNVAVSNFSVTLDYSTATNPVINLYWPQDGMEISGDSFTLRGQADDTSSSVKASITDEDGNVTTTYGMVERDGTLWVDDLPLGDGENDVALTVVNSAGYSSETDFTVVKSDMTLTLDYIHGDLWQPTVSVSGSISDSSCAISVNGVQGTNNGDGSWSAGNVPVSSSGEASFDVTASSPMTMSINRLSRMAASSSGNPVNMNKTLDKPDAVRLDSGTWFSESNDNSDDGPGLSGALEYFSDVWNWSRAGGGMETSYFKSYHATNSNYATWKDIYHILADRTVPLENVNYVDSTRPGSDTNYDLTSGIVINPDSAWQSDVPQGKGELSYHSPRDSDNWWNESGSVHLVYLSGGRMANGDQSLYAMSGSVTEKMVVNGAVVYSNIPPEQVTVSDLGNLDTNGMVMKMLPTQISRSADLSAGVPRSSVNIPWATRYRARIHIGGADVTDKTEDAVVGENIRLSCGLESMDGSDPPAITSYQWTVPGYAISNFYVSQDCSTGIVIEPFPKTNGVVNYYWVDGGSKQVQCTVQFAGGADTAKTMFNVLRPTIDFIGSIDNKVTYDTDYIFARDGIKCLHFGGSVSNGTTIQGIDCLATNANVFGYDQISSYGFIAVQTIIQDTRSMTRIDNSTTTTNETGLDGGFPTGSLGEGDGVLFSDCPGSGYSASYLTNYVQFTVANSFRTVAMFVPFGGIPVPIKEIYWNWSGSVSLINSQWSLTSSNATITINNRDTPSFPIWTNIVISSP